MPKVVKLTAQEIGGDISTVEIFHTAITASNLVSSSVSASILTGSGVTFVVDDSVTDFYAYVSGGLCLGTTGSITASVYSPSTRYLTFETSGSDEGGSIEMTSPFTIAATTSSFTASVNYNLYSLATVTANSATYPDDQFRGWYYSDTSSAAFATGSTLTLTLSTFTGSDHIYAFFSDS